MQSVLSVSSHLQLAILSKALFNFVYYSITLVESIPEGLVYPNKTIQPSIFDSWLRLIDIAESSIDIASFYWSLNGEDVVPHPSAWKVSFLYTLNDEKVVGSLKYCREKVYSSN